MRDHPEAKAELAIIIQAQEIGSIYLYINNRLFYKPNIVLEYA